VGAKPDPLDGTFMVCCTREDGPCRFPWTGEGITECPQKTLSMLQKAHSVTSAFFFSALRRYWYVLITGLLVGLCAAAASNSFLPKTYEASAQILLSAPKVADPAVSGVYVRERMPTYAQLIEAEAVLANARSLLGAEESTTFLSSHIKARVEVSTVLITITASWKDPQGAADLANAVARSYAQVAPRLDNVEDPILRVDGVEEAVAPSDPAGLSLVSLLLIGSVAGATVGLIAALLVRIFGRYAVGTEDMRDAADAEVLAVVVAPPAHGPNAAYSSFSPKKPSAGVDSFTTLYSRAGLAGQGPSPRLVVIVSTINGAHAGAVAWGMAATSAASGQRCLLIGADSDSRITLEVLFDESMELKNSCVPQLLTAEELIPAEGGVLTVDNTTELLRTAAASADVVVIAAPPLEVCANSRTFVQIAGEALIATPLRRSRIDRLRTSARLLHQAGASILGLVATVPTARHPKTSFTADRKQELIGA
jgi:polysaccharide biosynthesis transport protein